MELTASVDSKCAAVKDYNVCQRVCAERLNKIKREVDACQKTLAAGHAAQAVNTFDPRFERRLSFK